MYVPDDTFLCVLLGFDSEDSVNKAGVIRFGLPIVFCQDKLPPRCRVFADRRFSTQRKIKLCVLNQASLVH